LLISNAFTRYAEMMFCGFPQYFEANSEVDAKCSIMDEMRSSYKILVRRPEGKEPLGGPRRSGEYNINVGWIQLAQNWAQWRALVNTVMNLRIP
jgi:hypothetical protein